MNIRLHDLALGALTFLLLCSVGARADNEIAATFYSLYGRRIEQVKTTKDKLDDLALARELAADARKVEKHPGLLLLMCCSAHDLGAQHLSGRDTAIEAMELVYQKVPDKAEFALRKLLVLYPRQYGASQANKKKQVGAVLLARLLAMADICEQSGRYAEASKYNARAILLASSVDPTMRAQIQDKVKALSRRMAAQRKIDRYVSQLKDDPDDVVTRNKLIKVCLVEMDDPSAAMNFYTEDLDEVTKTYLPLAAKDPDDVAAPACFEMGQWYRSLAVTALSSAKPAMLRRARRFYRHFLDETAQNAPAGNENRIRAQMSLRFIDAELAKLARWVNLLPLVDPSRHTLSGIWKAGGGKIGTDTGSVASIVVPVRPTGSYELQVGFKRTDGDNTIIVNLPAGRHAVALLVSRMHGECAGLGLIDKINAGSNSTKVKTGVLLNKKLHTIAVKVALSGQNAHITVKLNNKQIIDWTGKQSALSVSGGWSLPGPAALGLAANEITLVVQTLKLRALPSQVTRLTRSQTDRLRKVLGYDPEKARRAEEDRQRRLEELQRRKEYERRLREGYGDWWGPYPGRIYDRPRYDRPGRDRPGH